MIQVPLTGVVPDAEYALIACGSREWPSATEVRKRLVRYPKSTIVIHGNNGNADLAAKEYAVEQRMPQVPVPYFGWLGKRGGCERNRVMAHILCEYRRMGYVVCVEAFSLGTSGTTDMMNQARLARVQIFATSLVGGVFKTWEPFPYQMKLIGEKT